LEKLLLVQFIEGLFPREGRRLFVLQFFEAVGVSSVSSARRSTPNRKCGSLRDRELFILRLLRFASSARFWRVLLIGALLGETVLLLASWLPGPCR